MNTHHERIVELEADVARLKWQVAQLIEAARKEHAEREAANAYAKEIFRKRLLAETHTDMFAVKAPDSDLAK